jgi:hypothetical protein
MNSVAFIHRSWFSVICGLLTAVTAAGANQPSKPLPAGTLQVQINIPPSWQPLFEDRVTDAFVSHVSSIFHDQGYKGDIVEVRSFDEPSPGCCLLKINLVEWRMDHSGNIDCTFTASVQTDHALRDLGVFSGIAFRWMNLPGRFGLADTFGDAADEALRDLYRSLARTELIPGVRKA